METISFFVITGIFLLIYVGTVIGMRLYYKNLCESRYADGVRQGTKDAHESHIEKDLYPLRMIKVTVPTFGAPSLRVYHSVDYVIPLQCTECKENLEEGDDYYEIPILNAEPGSVTAVHLACERKNVYGKKTERA